MTGNFPKTVTTYLAKRGVKGSWRLAGDPANGYEGAIIIPSLAEGDSLFTTLENLSSLPTTDSARFLTVVVVNQRQDAASTDREQNRRDLARLARVAPEQPFPLAWVDATSPGRELPDKQGGVGLARKIGMDLALIHLDWSGQPLLAALDADTLVEPNYLACLRAHFAASGVGAAVLPIAHQPATDPDQQEAIDRYELFLRSYVLGLDLAGSPYAFMTVGSAMVCTARTYVRCGGMNTRKAAEDFYFLDKLAKTVGVSTIFGTTVSPSPRLSQRVPFGTGKSMDAQLNQQKPVLYYPKQPFLILGCWLKMVTENPGESASLLLASAKGIHPVLGDYLKQVNWLQVWPKLQKNHKQPERLAAAFHAWFDGLKTLRLIHALCAHAFPRGRAEQTLPELFAEQNLECPATPARQLDILRRLQNNDAS